MGFGVWGFLWPPAVEGWPGSLADLVMVADGGRDGGRDAAVVVDSCWAGKEVGVVARAVRASHGGGWRRWCWQS
jgi:hypothetical protein